MILYVCIGLIQDKKTAARKISSTSRKQKRKKSSWSPVKIDFNFCERRSTRKIQRENRPLSSKVGSERNITDS